MGNCTKAGTRLSRAFSGGIKEDAPLLAGVPSEQFGTLVGESRRISSSASSPKDTFSKQPSSGAGSKCPDSPERQDDSYLASQREPSEASPYLYGLGRRLAADVYSTGTTEGVGQQLPINPMEPVSFENEEISGHIVFLHRPDPEPQEGWPYAEHFRSSKRRFELRLQGRLKKQAEQIYFGGELPDPIQLSWTMQATATAATRVVNGLSAARGVPLNCCAQHKVHASDDGQQDVERQHLVWPLFAADTLIATPAGETPPLLTDSFENTPLAEKRAVRFNTTDTYTFVYYTMYIDYIRWSVCNMPAGWMNRPFSAFLGDSPINLVAYRLEDAKGEHTQRNKRYLARLVFTNTDASAEASGHEINKDLPDGGGSQPDSGT